MNTTVAAVILTYNRKHLISESLQALLAQTRPLDRILVVDNGSVDDTHELLKNTGLLDRESIEYLRLPENIGAAGGYNEGIHRVYISGYEWIWIMDDDAITAPDSLEALLDNVQNNDCVYGTSPVSTDGRLCWEAVPSNHSATPYQWWHDLPDVLDVTSHPFLGFLINRNTIKAVGLPDPGFFIYGEDVDYSERIRKKGVNIKLVKHSRIRHPVHESIEMRFLGKRTLLYKVPAWKRYYDTRNRIIVSSRHRGIRLLTRTLPGSLLRLLGAMAREGEYLSHIRVFIAGTVDGLLGRMGKRHHKWHIT